MGIALEKSDHAVFRMDGDSIPISVSERRRDDLPHRDIFKFSDALEGVTYLSPFDCELMFVIDVLIRAAAAAAEIGTLRLDAMQRAFLEIDKFRLRELLFLAHNFGRDGLSLNRIRNKDRLAVFTGDAFTAESDVFDF